jgi:hypothetical protein
MRHKTDYGKQRRNTYGEAPHAARKAIPRAKQRQNQKERRSVRAELSRGDTEAADQVSVRARVRRSFKKVPDQPLGHMLMTGAIRQFIKRKITAAAFRSKMRRLREQYPSFVREYRAFMHGYSHVQLDEDTAAVLAEFK